MTLRLSGLVVCLLVLAAWLNLGLALAMIPRSDEVRYGEATIYAHAARLLHGAPLYQPLYQPLDSSAYTAALYTPLFYVLAAAMHAALGPGFWTGRLLSFGGGLDATHGACSGSVG